MKKIFTICFVLVIFMITNSSVCHAYFDSNYDPFQEGIMISGRMCFYDPVIDYSKFFENGDEVGFFTGDVCFGVSDTKHADYPWYVNLQMNTDYYTGIEDGSLDYYVMAHNSDNQTVWNTQITGYNFDNHRIHVRANHEIPEPATLILLGFGGLFLKRRK